MIKGVEEKSQQMSGEKKRFYNNYTTALLNSEI